MDFILYILLLLFGGCLGGLMAGLLGVGGGVILTPIQYFLLVSIGTEPAIAMPVSFATSLAVIFVSMIRSTYRHYLNNFVVTDFLPAIMISGFLSAMIGALISVNVDVSLLRILFAVLCFVAVINMILLKYPENNDDRSNSLFAHLFLGIVGGLLCGLLGVGGGIIMIPILTLILRYPTHEAIGTSSASIIATSLGGMIAYIILGWNVASLPAYSVGYVNIVQFIFLGVSSFIVSGFAADWSKKVDERVLKFCHIIIVLYIGLKMMGIL